MKQLFKLVSIGGVIGVFTSPPAHASQEFDPDQALKKREEVDKSFYLEYLNYEQTIYSSDQEFEAGEKTKFEGAVKIKPSDDSFLRLRLEIDPTKNVYENETSTVEVILNHVMQEVEVQVDLNLKFDDHGRGATTVGLDDDSEYSFIAYRPNDTFAFIFYPYNFDGEVGRVFYTNDVTRIFYIEGTPNFIAKLPIGDESIRTKALPGIEVQFKLGHWQAYAGIAAGRYLYPAQDQFRIEENIAAERWTSKTDVGYKAGLSYRSLSTDFLFEMVTHDQARKTGSLLASAASAQWLQRFHRFSFYLESSYSEAGKSAYHLEPDGDWFAETTPFKPIFSDLDGEKQSWLGKKDFAHYLKFAYAFDRYSPYLSYKNVGKDFVFWEAESVHRLRTADQSESHGGLSVIGLGVDLKVGNYTFTPEYEYFVAKNRVFGNKNDLRDDRRLEELSKKASAFTLYVTYSL